METWLQLPGAAQRSTTRSAPSSSCVGCEGLAFRFQGWGFRVWSLVEPGIHHVVRTAEQKFEGLDFRAQDSGFRVQGVDFWVESPVLGFEAVESCAKAFLNRKATPRGSLDTLTVGWEERTWQHTVRGRFAGWGGALFASCILSTHPVPFIFSWWVLEDTRASYNVNRSGEGEDLGRGQGGTWNCSSSWRSLNAERARNPTSLACTAPAHAPRSGPYRACVSEPASLDHEPSAIPVHPSGIHVERASL